MIKRLFIIICATFTALNLAAEGTSKYCPRFNDFNDLTVSSDINVIYKCNPDSAGYAIFECHPSVAHAITFSFNKQKLKIEVITDSALVYELPTVIVFSSSLNKVTNLGSETITVNEPAPVEDLSLKVIGNGAIVASGVKCTRLSAAAQAGKGTVTVSGAANEANYTVAGAGAVGAASTTSVKSKCWLTFTGSIECNVRESLTVYGAGSGTVYYIGDPKTIKKRAPGVKLEQITEDE